MTDSPTFIRPEHLSPLPVRLRRFAYESMDSYIRRSVRANGITVDVVRQWLIQQGALIPDVDQDGWYSAWYALGALHQRRSRSRTNVPVVAERQLCTRCTHGEYASGPLAQYGLVCLKHRCWIDPRDGGNVDGDSLAAEKLFRRELVSQGFTLESPEMRFTLRLTRLAVDQRWFDVQLRNRGTQSAAGALFVPQVTLAAALFVGDGLTTLSGAPVGERLLPCTQWIAQHVDGISSNGEPWRAGALLSHLILEYQRIEVVPDSRGGTHTDVLQRLSR